MRPTEVEALLEELKTQNVRSHVRVDGVGKMIIGNDDVRYTFTADECKLLLANKENVDTLFEALDYPEDAFVELYGIDTDQEVWGQLEEWSSSVDEL
jgi:hypothetical protein